MPLRKRTDYIVVHVSATKPSQNLNAADLRVMHKAKGWSDIGYNRVIRRDGTREMGRGYDAIGAHVEGYNSISLGVVLVGGVDEKGKPQNNATPEQLTALEAELRDLIVKYPKAKICGHRDLSPDKDGDGSIEPFEHIKACPCFDAIPWAESKGLPGADIRGSWNPAGPGPVPGPDARTVYLQKLLLRAGYAIGPADGLIGKKTRDGLKAFQLWAGIEQTGAFDSPTVTRLRAMFEAPAAQAA